jgi:hypothetical protein
MNLLSKIVGSASTLEAAPAQTLDQLWHEAEQLGRVEVDKRIFGEGEYDVSIRFDTRSGSSVSAKGRDRVIHFAMAKAINEARDLGAGWKP